MATLLDESNILNRSVIHGTDLNSDVLKVAKNGAYPLKNIEEWEQNYRSSGGQSEFSNYYAEHFGSAKFKEEFRQRLSLSKHNLVSDGPIGTFDLIMCRNVLIYFQKPLQSKVIRLFKNSLATGGYLCLGAKESLLFAHDSGAFETVDAKEKIYRKK